MSYLDDLKTINKTQLDTSTVAPQKDKTRAGYFDWDKHAKNDEAVGVILPPYVGWLDQRIQAARSGAKFDIPFYLMCGKHAIGARQDKQKVFVECRRTLVQDNKVGAGYGLLHPDAVAGGEECPICAACWDDVWPRVKENEGRKDSPEYKQFKEAHRQLCPQQKYVFNFLPMGTTEPVVFEAAKTLGDQLKNIHYDPKQPDLLWPFSNPPHFLSAWVQIRREKNQDVTKYIVNTIYVGMPHILNADQSFAQNIYEQIVAKLPDLRELSKSLVPDANSMTKGIQKMRQTLVNFGLAVATDHATAARVEAATAGVVGGGAAAQVPPVGAPAAPAMTMPTVAPPPSVSVGPAPVGTPAMPPMVGQGLTQTAPPPRSPVAGGDSTAATDLLASLLAQPAQPPK